MPKCACHSGRALDHGWPESRTSQARSAQCCRMRSFSLHEAFVKQARDSTRQGALRKLVGASWSAQVALRKLLRASCSGKLVPASGSLQVALCKLRSLQVALCKLLCASCSVQVALRKLLCASCSRQGALRKLVGASWSAQVALCNLLCASCSAQVALKCKLHLVTPARGPGRNRTRDPPVPGAGARTTRQLPRTSSNNKSRKTSSTSTTPIPAEGCASTAEIAKNLEFLHLDHADPRRGLREQGRNRKKPRVFAPRPRRRGLCEQGRNRKKPRPRPRRSPQRVARAGQKSQKTSSFCTSTTPIPAEGRAGTLEIAKNHGFLHLDHADPRRGSIFV